LTEEDRMNDRIDLQECDSTSSSDCYTQNDFTFDGEKVEIHAPAGREVAGVWIDPDAWAGDAYAEGPGYGVAFTREAAPNHDQEALAMTGGDLGTPLALGLAIALLITGAALSLRSRWKRAKR
jgi:hypothetical protein